MSGISRLAPVTAKHLVRARPRGFAAFGLAAVGLFGMWTSLRYSFGSWAPDSDIGSQIDVLQGIHQHGLAFIPTWRCTSDNWLLSLTPLLAVIYGIFGTSPHVVIGVGWLIFLASVGLTAMAAHRAAGPRAAAAVFVLTIFASFWDLGDGGFMSFPVTHNISLVWGLLTLLAAESAIIRVSGIAAAATAVFTFIDVQSDPWAGAAIAMLLIIVSAGLALLNWRRREGGLAWRYACLVCGGTAIGLLLAQTKLFHTIHLLPATPLAITDAAGLVNNAGWLFRIFGVMFNIVPGADADVVPANIVSFLTFCVFAAIIGGLVIGSLRTANYTQKLILGVGGLSMIFVTILFLTLQWTDLDLENGRFFMNCHFFLPLLAATAVFANWRRIGVSIRVALAAYAGLLVAAGVASYPGMWTGQAALAKPTDIQQISSVLEKNGLTYGYGSYWEAEALAMNWMTHGRVTIRPVGYYGNIITTKIDQTSSLWYTPSDEPPNTRDVFLFIVSDPPICPTVADCIAVAKSQVGPPARQLNEQGFTVLVYDHPILNRLLGH